MFINHPICLFKVHLYLCWLTTTSGVPLLPWIPGSFKRLNGKLSTLGSQCMPTTSDMRSTLGQQCRRFSSQYCSGFILFIFCGLGSCFFLWIVFILFIFCGLDPTRFCNLLEWVKKQIRGGRLVLCHCIRGRNRSPAMASGLLAWSTGQSVRSCVSWV